jgi:hypothetical protein
MSSTMLRPLDAPALVRNKTSQDPSSRSVLGTGPAEGLALVAGDGTDVGVGLAEGGGTESDADSAGDAEPPPQATKTGIRRARRARCHDPFVRTEVGPRPVVAIESPPSSTVNGDHPTGAQR